MLCKRCGYCCFMLDVIIVKTEFVNEINKLYDLMPEMLTHKNTKNSVLISNGVGTLLFAKFTINLGFKIHHVEHIIQMFILMIKNVVLEKNF